jgi:PAS domain S-box-containing protein
VTREPSGPEARDTLPPSDEILRLVFESVTDFAIIATDCQGCITSWNSGAERLLGYTEDDILNRPADVVFTPEDRAIGVPEREREEALALGRAQNERWHVRKDSSRFWGSGVLTPLADRSGFVKIMRDLTERRLAYERLEESEQLFRLLATNIPQLVFRTRGTGERTWGSPQWVVFTGLAFDESIGFGWLDAVHPEDRDETRAQWEIARSSGEYGVEHRIRRSSDGEYRWHQTRAKPLGQGTDDWVGTSTDIHDMRGLQEQQKVLLAELQHRSRNLLAVVQSIARQTIRSSDSFDRFASEFEGRLRALGRVQSILAGVDSEAIDLRVLVEAEMNAHGHGKMSSQKLELNGPRILLPPTSAQTLALAIHELATNALKYGALQEAAGRLAISWQIQHANDGKPYIVFDWTESGVTMPSAETLLPRKGYGRELIERALPYQLQAETKFEFSADGVHCRITSPLKDEEGRDA